MTKPKTKKKLKSGVRERANLHAPWRIKFILGKRKPGCFLCDAARIPVGHEKRWKELLLLHRDEHSLIIMNKYPYGGGHLLIAPLRHTHELPSLSEAESRSMWENARLAVAALEKSMQPHGVNLGMNLGKAAGAGVEDHLHMHALPRWVGDTNFMIIVTGTHMVHSAMEDVWEELRPFFLKKSKVNAQKQIVEGNADNIPV